MWLVLQLLLLSIIQAVYGQSCPVNGQLRLVQTASINLPNSGRVEICMGGVWGTIAADSVATPWSEKNVQVACIELGFSGALNSVFQRTIPPGEQSALAIHLTSVSCSGTELSIADCPHSTSTQNVDHGHDAYIVCREESFSYSVAHPGNGPQSGDIRLFGDTRNGHGAVQIFTGSQGWQGICPDNSWANSDAATICQDLGYQSGTIATPVSAVSGPGGVASPRLLYASNCPGRQTDSIIAGVCSFAVQSSPTESCDFPQDSFAAVQCSEASETSVRLIGGSHSQEGIVEIAYNGRWGMLCNAQFTVQGGEAICRGLGFGSDDAEIRSVLSNSAVLGSASNLRPIWLNDLACAPNEPSLSACITEENVIGFADCHTSTIVAVDCGNPRTGLSRGQVAGVVIGVFVGIGVLVYIGVQLEKLKKANKAAADRAAQSQPLFRRTQPPNLEPSVCEPESEHEFAEFNLEPTVGIQPSAPAPHIIPPTSSDEAIPPLLEPSTHDQEPLIHEEPSAPGAVLSISPPPSFDDASSYPTKSMDPPPPYPGRSKPPPINDTYPHTWGGIDYPQNTYPYPINSPFYPQP